MSKIPFKAWLIGSIVVIAIFIIVINTNNTTINNHVYENNISDEKIHIETVVEKFIQAIKYKDIDALKQLCTDKLYTVSVAVLHIAEIEDFDTSNMEVSSVLDRIEGDIAYVNNLIILQGKTTYEQIVLKKYNGIWLVAGKQGYSDSDYDKIIQNLKSLEKSEG